MYICNHSFEVMSNRWSVQGHLRFEVNLGPDHMVVVSTEISGFENPSVFGIDQSLSPSST